MHFSTIATALLLPLMAVADQSTTTCTSTQYLTKTITLSRIHTTTMTYSNATTSYQPTAVTYTSVGSTFVPSTTAEATVSPTINNAGAALNVAQAAVAAVAGLVVVALM